ncbi:hypothetical protein [uncultured Winogradskyella sp.]|uniref:hypothetical protein n=1 Tax=uncultured Winogradskyella sp. TaxID=395353 RepID=UPI002614AA80|nr:hypothetical protein [uncultured Winogradskyella sp.]
MKIIVLFVLFLGSQFLFSQDEISEDNKIASVNNVYGIQLGVLGVWCHYEKKITKTITLRSELGLDFGFRKGVLTNNNVVFAFIPNIVLEPRWYYNFKNRVEKGRSVRANSGGFLGLKLQYLPDFFVISNKKNLSVSESISFIPKIGYRKVWDSNLVFESAFGIGKQYGFESNLNDISVDLTFRIGYNF